ncbi:hypothetical protein [Pseudodesulfovibrio tunisiensis]|uniref:hypothetical protein n=1 Tax=Pseudodesulfovibrio tunisiensis TaxID=463192 RepID=UPI001FB42174|nr:hypothetical protein [Pseudodesulfovibrio tunisiensis]
MPPSEKEKHIRHQTVSAGADSYQAVFINFQELIDQSNNHCENRNMPLPCECPAFASSQCNISSSHSRAKNEKDTILRAGSGRKSALRKGGFAARKKISAPLDSTLSRTRFFIAAKIPANPLSSRQCFIFKQPVFHMVFTPKQYAFDKFVFCIYYIFLSATISSICGRHFRSF